MSTSTTAIENSPAEANGQSVANRLPANSARRRRTPLDEYDAIAWRLRPQLEADSGTATLLGVVSAAEGAGSTTIATNLANRLVDHVDGPVLLVDANFYRPRTERLLRLKKNPGLAEVLADDLPIAEAVQATHLDGLHLLAAGRGGMFDQLGVSPNAFTGVVNELREQYTAVVIDLPTATNMGPSLLLAQQCDGVLLVAQSERTRRGETERATKRLELDNVPVIGAVLNRDRQHVPQWISRWF